MKGVEAPALFKEKELIDVNSATKEEIDGLPESATQNQGHRGISGPFHDAG